MDLLYKNVYQEIEFKNNIRKPKYVILWNYIIYDMYNNPNTFIKITFAADTNNNFILFQYENEKLVNLEFYTAGGSILSFIAQYKTNNYISVFSDGILFYEIVNSYDRYFRLDKNLIQHGSRLIIDKNYGDVYSEIIGQNIINSFLIIGNKSLSYQAGFQVLYNMKDRKQLLIRFYSINKKVTIQLLIVNDKIYYCNIPEESILSTQKICKEDEINLVNTLKVRSNINFL